MQRKGQFDKVAELQYGKLPDWRRRLKEVTQAEAEEQNKPSAAAPAAHPGRRRGNRRGRVARHGHSGVAR